MAVSNGRGFSELLKQERKRRGWSQTDVAEKVGTDPNTVSRWERGLNVPGPYACQRLCEVFEKTPQTFGLFQESLEATSLQGEVASEQQEIVSETLPRSLSSVLFSSVLVDQKLAGSLGQSLELDEDKAAQARLPTGTVTMLFTDIEGSTRLLQQLGEEYSSVLAQCRSLLRTIFQRYHGQEVDTQGDAFFIAFARATDAVSAAVEVQKTLSASVWPKGLQVRVRMGLHTGEPIYTTEGYVGLDVHQAARIMSVGHGGQVLLSQTTRYLVEYNLPEGVSLRDLGEHRLKDLQHPSHLFQLVITDLPADFPPPKTLDAFSNNLPVQPTPLIGREKEVASIMALLNREEVRLLTLTGPGGTGKTRLALQVAAELSEAFADGVYFVNLAPLRDPQFVLSALAQTLGLQETAEQSSLDLLQAALCEKQLLLVLDNFEQVIEAASQVAALLATCLKLKIIVTSRTVLHVRAERELEVPPLALPDPKHLPDLVTLSQYEAVALFIQRAQAIKPGFQITNATAPAVAEICVRLDGLPLAIELAAARIKLFPPPALLARLSKRFSVLIGGSCDAPARQQTLRDTIAWSYELLDTEEQLLFRRLSVFVGGATLEAVEALYTALGQEPGQVLEKVASLIDKSLVLQIEQNEEVPRLHMLETIREYGLERLETLGELQAAQEVHTHYYLRLAEEVGLHSDGTEDEGRWLNLLEQDYDNLRTALAWMVEGGEKRQTEMTMQLCEALSRFWQTRGHVSEGRIFMKRLLEAEKGIDAPVRAKMLLAAAGIAWLGGVDQAEEYAQAALALFRVLGDKAGSAEALLELAAVAWRRGDGATSRTLKEEAVALIRETGDKGRLTNALFVLADGVCMQGEYARGFALWDECLALSREVGNKSNLVWALMQSALWIFGCQGDATTMHARLAEALLLIQEVGDKQAMAHHCTVAAVVASSEGDLATAHALAEESLARYREMEIPWYAAGTLLVLAGVEVREGNPISAHLHLEEALRLARQVGDNSLTPYCLETLAAVAVTEGELAWAARLWGTAEALRENNGFPIPLSSRHDYDHAVAEAHAQFGEQAFAAAWAQGRTMTPEQVLASKSTGV